LMLRMSWTRPYEGPLETLRFRRDQNPLRRGLGHFTDEDGAVWDVHAIRGSLVNARKVSAHRAYYSTASATAGIASTQDTSLIQTWNPYRVEEV
jgi:hypothetical protein